VLCDVEDCPNLATWNHQSGTITWEINEKTGRYEYSEFYADGMENEHKCDEHNEQ